jgi:hypothetical protein
MRNPMKFYLRIVNINHLLDVKRIFQILRQVILLSFLFPLELIKWLNGWLLGLPVSLNDPEKSLLHHIIFDTYNRNIIGGAVKRLVLEDGRVS